ADAGTLVLVVLSGGASSLLVAPAAGLTLDDKQALAARLLASGADIADVNVVRKHCSRVKGGGLARQAARAGGLWTLVLSDVVGDYPATIASGPTGRDTSTLRDGAAVLGRYLAPEGRPVALEPEPCVLLAAGTDGVDGPTDAAGACVDGGTVARARARGLDPAAALAATDSHPLLDATGDLLRTGPTGTNVADLVVALRAAC